MNKFELAAFVQTATTFDDCAERVDRILKARATLRGLTGRVAQKRFQRQTVETQCNLAGIRKPKPATFRDYADTTFRYSRRTGTLCLQGSRLGLLEEKGVLVNSILEHQSDLLAPVNSLEYLVEFYRGALLPAENINTALEEISHLEGALIQAGVAPLVTAGNLQEQNPEQLVASRHSIVLVS